MKKNRLGSAEVGSCICYGLMALLQVGWLAVLLTAQLVPPVWVTLMVYCVALALFLLGQTLRVVHRLQRPAHPRQIAPPCNLCGRSGRPGPCI